MLETGKTLLGDTALSYRIISVSVVQRKHSVSVHRDFSPAPRFLLSAQSVSLDFQQQLPYAGKGPAPSQRLNLVLVGPVS